MSLYRVKQFYWSLTSKICLDDLNLINTYLDSSEQKLFYNLSISEQKHSINVARDIIRLSESKNFASTEILIKAALLHDIGKTLKRLNPIEKSIIVILEKISNGKIKRFKSIKMIDIYYNHPDKGYTILLSKQKYNTRLLYFIKNHHNDNIVGDKELNVLKICDSRN